MNAETAPPHTPYEALGGEAVIRAIVDRFYDLMDADPAYCALRAMHAPDLTPMRESLSGWLVAWTGGPRDWFIANPGKCVMSAHRDLGVSPATAAQWVAAMKRAIADSGPEDQALGQMMAERLEMMAQSMVPAS